MHVLEGDSIVIGNSTVSRNSNIPISGYNVIILQVSKILLLTMYATCDLEMSFSFELSIVALSKSRVNVGYDVINARHISRGMRPTIVSKTIGDFPCHYRAIR